MMTDAVQDMFNRLRSELDAALAAKKCWRCGCFQDAVRALGDSPALRQELGGLLAQAQQRFEPRRYDCLGCELCWPAVATNLAAVLDPAVADAGHCPTEESAPQPGWPPLPGDYRALRYRAPVAVCVLNSDSLIKAIAAAGEPHVAIVGSLHTENLGIERIIHNLLPNPNIRFLVLCGEDTRRAIGHLPGQSLASLMCEGLDDHMRIQGAKGKRPVIKNLSREVVEAFRQRVELIDCIGELQVEAVLDRVADAARRDPGPVPQATMASAVVPEHAEEPKRLIPDPKGYFIVYPDYARSRLMLEHYNNQGVLDRMFEGLSPAALYSQVIEEGLVSRLDHAAYLGRELAHAEHALLTEENYVQDRALGELEVTDATPEPSTCSACRCGPESKR